MRHQAVHHGDLPVRSWQQMLGEAVSDAAADRCRYGGNPVHLGQHRATQGRGVVASQYAGRRAGVATYLNNTAADRLLAVLPFSFDYGLSQLTTAFSVGASVVLMDYLLPRDVIRAVARYTVTGLAAVPPLWNQLAGLPWPDEAVASCAISPTPAAPCRWPPRLSCRRPCPTPRCF